MTTLRTEAQIKNAKKGVHRVVCDDGVCGFKKDMSGRRPVVKGLVVALGTLRVRSCLRPVGAGNESPAGPDAGPHGSSPNQQNALFMAPALFPGLPSRSVGSHRFAVALDADRLTAKPRSC
jgi:hypothetical protein